MNENRRDKQHNSKNSQLPKPFLLSVIPSINIKQDKTIEKLMNELTINGKEGKH